VNLAISSLRKVFAGNRGTTVALDGIDATIPDRQYVCIVGPSGCGKSTLLSLVAGLGSPTSGQISYQVLPDEKLRIGMVFQDFALFPWRTAAENVAFGLEELGLPPEEIGNRVRRFIEVVDLVGFEHHHPRQLSGGMRQRVGLARALAIEPALLLLDEPFSALDVQTRQIQHEQLLKIWQQEPRTTLHVTHDIAEAVFLADRVIVLTERPARIAMDVAVPLPRPRQPDVVHKPEFHQTVARIWDLLRDSAARALRGGVGAP
jgi:NitT/TauT family transport system ATP-binding protein